jgi:hypothetical protein
MTGFDEPESTAEEWLDATRRQLLGGVGAGAASGVAGCGARQDSAESPEVDPAQRGTASPGHDHAGDYLGESTPVERIDVNRLNGSTRLGDTVYYDPDERGPYSDLTAAIADVPRGGTLQLGHGAYNLAEEGRLVIDHEMTVRGVGWTRVNNWNRRTDGRNTYGTVLRNVQNPAGDVGSEFTNRQPAVEAPAVEINVDTHEGNGRHVVLRDLAVRSPTPSLPIVRVSNTIRTLVADCLITGGIKTRAGTGIQYTGSSFFAQAYRNVINGTGNYGIQVLGGGYAHAFYDNHVRCEGNGEGEAVAFETTRHRSIVMGGEYTGQIGLRFRSTGATQLGGFVVEPGFESNDVAVDVGAGDGGSFDNVQIYHTKLSMAAEHVAEGVRFGNTTGSKYVFPIVWQRGDRLPIAEWTERAENCGVIADAGTLEKVTTIDHGATAPSVTVPGAATRPQLDAIPTDVPTTVGYVDGVGTPAVHDRNEWQVPTMQSLE